MLQTKFVISNFCLSLSLFLFYFCFVLSLVIYRYSRMFWHGVTAATRQSGWYPRSILFLCKYFLFFQCICMTVRHVNFSKCSYGSLSPGLVLVGSTLDRLSSFNCLGSLVTFLVFLTQKCISWNDHWFNWLFCQCHKTYSEKKEILVFQQDSNPRLLSFFLSFVNIGYLQKDELKIRRFLDHWSIFVTWIICSSATASANVKLNKTCVKLPTNQLRHRSVKLPWSGPWTLVKSILKQSCWICNCL